MLRILFIGLAAAALPLGIWAWWMGLFAFTGREASGTVEAMRAVPGRRSQTSEATVTVVAPADLAGVYTVEGGSLARDLGWRPALPARGR